MLQAEYPKDTAGFSVTDAQKKRPLRGRLQNGSFCREMPKSGPVCYAPSSLQRARNGPTDGRKSTETSALRSTSAAAST